jgi:hypothetical protein
MPEYTVKVELPENIKNVLEMMTGVAHVSEFIPWEGSVVLELEAKDEYELAETIRSLQDELNATAGYMGMLLIDRPKPKKAS